MKILLNFITLIFILIFARVAKAQLVLSNYSGQAEISAATSVTLTNGFHATGNVRIFTTGSSYQSCVPQTSIPSINQNYILSRTFKVAGVSAANVSTVRNVCEENQQVQYLDGLGRPLQTVTVNGGLAGHDIVIPVKYDAFGREDRKYLPYTVWNNNGAFRADAISGGGQASYYNSPPGGIKPTATPFSQKIFEASPLNRVIEQGAPGNAWQPAADNTSGHTVKTEYGTNMANEVRLWTVSATGAHGTDFYLPGKLSKTLSKDENWTSGRAGTTEEFRDLDERVIMKCIWEDENKGLRTYYVYDNYGNLRYVLPPAVNAGTDRGNVMTSFTESQKEFSDFIYAYYYDGRKRLIRKKIPGKGWEEMIYNPIDQVVFTQDAVQKGLAHRTFIKYDAIGRVTMTGVEYNHTGLRDDVQATVNSLSPLWDSGTTAAGNYHGYNNASAPNYTPNMRPDVVNYYDHYDIPGLPYSYGSAYSQQTKGLLTATKVRVLDTEDWLWTVNYYDNEARVVKTYKQHYLSGSAQAGNYDETTNTYNFDSSLATSTRLHVVNNSTALTVANRYEYDHQGRPLATFEKINNQAEITLNHMVYNELGQLKQKKRHNDIQTTEYTYNERNWMTGSTSNEFSMELRYENGTTPRYNGDITNQLWGAGSSLNNTFTYTYDRLSRLTKGSSSGITMSEELTYDVMGNIKSLARDGGNANYYDYQNGNQLWYVAYVTNGYSYDINGNVIVDGRSGFTMEYNHLNLPKRIPNINLNYTYDATGRRLRKNSNGNLRNYIDGIEYTLDGSIDFVQTAEGLAQNNGGTYTYHYNLNDHLGNVRYTFDIYNGVVRRLQQDDFYPFGMKKSTLVGENKYLYNGKELQSELGDQYDYGARFYDPVIGRWNVVDAAAEYYPDIAVYAYAVNDPIGFTDNDGEMPGPVGAIIGVLSDYISQVGVNYFVDKKDFRTSLMDVSYWSLGVSAVSGFATGGISSLSKTLTSGVGKQAFVKVVDFGVDVMVNTVQSAVTNNLETGEFDIWKSFTGGLIEASIGGLLPLKYVDKLEKQLSKKMGVSARKMAKYKNKMKNDSNRSRSTQLRNAKKYNEQAAKYQNYTDALIGVKTVNDAYKVFGTQALMNLDLYKKIENNVRSTITVGEIDNGVVIQ